MQIQLFRIPVAAEEVDIEQVNRFFASHRIVNVDKRFVDAGRERTSAGSFPKSRLP